MRRLPACRHVLIEDLRLDELIPILESGQVPEKNEK